MDYIPQMSDPNLNPKPHLAFSIPRILTTSRKRESDKDGSSSSDPQSSFPFCPTCLANQNLQLNLLANYLPGDLDSQNPNTRADTRALLDNLPAYKASLEARYPILCSACSLKASEIIKERNYKVKAFSLNESVKRHVKPFHTPPLSSHQSAPLPLSGMGGPLWTLREWLWRTQALVWLSCYVVSISVAFYCRSWFFEVSISAGERYSSHKNRFASFCFFKKNKFSISLEKPLSHFNANYRSSHQVDLSDLLWFSAIAFLRLAVVYLISPGQGCARIGRKVSEPK